MSLTYTNPCGHPCLLFQVTRRNTSCLVLGRTHLGQSQKQLCGVEGNACSFPKVLLPPSSGLHASGHPSWILTLFPGSLVNSPLLSSQETVWQKLSNLEHNLVSEDLVPEGQECDVLYGENGVCDLSHQQRCSYYSTVYFCFCQWLPPSYTLSLTIWNNCFLQSKTSMWGGGHLQVL